MRRLRLHLANHAGLVVLLLSIVIAGAYALILSLLGYSGRGCEGPPARSLAGYMTVIVPILLLLVGASVVVGVGLRHAWRRTTILAVAIGMLLAGAGAELLIFIIQYSINGCAAG